MEKIDFDPKTDPFHGLKYVKRLSSPKQPAKILKVENLEKKIEKPSP